MASKIAAALFFLILPFSAQAEDADYLLISFDYVYADSSVINLGAEQRVMDSAEVVQLPGEFTLALIDGSQSISQINFSIPSQEAEASHETTAPPTAYSKTVAIPILKSITAEGSSIEIKKGTQLLTSKKLSDINLEILAVKDNVISVPEEEISYPPLPSENNNSWLAYAIGSCLVGIILGIWYWSNRRRKQQI